MSISSFYVLVRNALMCTGSQTSSEMPIFAETLKLTAGRSPYDVDAVCEKADVPLLTQIASENMAARESPPRPPCVSVYSVYSAVIATRKS